MRIVCLSYFCSCMKPLQCRVFTQRAVPQLPKLYLVYILCIGLNMNVLFQISWRSIILVIRLSLKTIWNAFIWTHKSQEIFGHKYLQKCSAPLHAREQKMAIFSLMTSSRSVCGQRSILERFLQEITKQWKHRETLKHLKD